MNIHQLALYQVIEFNDGIVFMPAGKVVPPKALKLFAGSATACGEYLVRYLHGRENFKSTAKAHREAAAGAAQKLGLETAEFKQ